MHSPTAQEKIHEAVAQIVKIDTVKKLAGAIQKNATKIDRECITINVGVRRLLNDAPIALADADSAATWEASLPDVQDGAA